VSRFLFLDSGPLGLLTHPQRSAEVVAIADWLMRCLVSGSRVIVPAIVYYELKRELLPANKSFGIARLDAFVAATPGGYLALSDEALRLAADLRNTRTTEPAPRGGSRCSSFVCAALRGPVHFGRKQGRRDSPRLIRRPSTST